MLNFNIDLSDTAQEFHLGKGDIDALCNYTVDRVVDGFMEKWQDLVNGQLNSTRDEYKRAMYTDRPDERTAIIGLTARESRIPMMIEVGAEPFDEKIGFMNSDKKVAGIDGRWYLTIPFRHGSSEAIMEMMVPGGGVSVIDLMKQGGTVTQAMLPEPFSEAQTHRLELNTGSIITYKHKAPIYEGMHRQSIGSTQAENRGGYFTFRRVSDKTDPSAWIHPGFTPHLFMDKTLHDAQLGAIVDNAVQDWLDVKFG